MTQQAAPARATPGPPTPSQPAVALQAVLFDMDGLLVNTEPLWFEVEVEVVGALGGQWSPADQVAIMGAALPHAVRYMRAKADSDVPEEEVGEMIIAAMERRLAASTIPVQPGAAALLAEVANSGLPFALVSASVRRIINPVLDSFARSGLPEFPLSIAGDEVERSKPDPLPYLTAARLLDVEIAASVVLEDSVNGVRAARASGATVVAVPHVVPIGPGPRLHVRSSLEEVDLAELRQLVGT